VWSAERQHTAVASGAILLFTALAALVVYWLTLAPDLTWAHHGIDGGELITAVYTHGLPHPPGYPLYRLFASWFASLPLGTIAYRFNLFSALTTALAAGFVALTSYQSRLLSLTDKLTANSRGVTAVATGLTFAFASLVWGQATITEVYGLALLLQAAFLWALLTQRTPWLIGLLLGLSITAQLTAWLMLPLALALSPRRCWLRLLGALLLGLLPLALLPWLAAPASPVVWGDPATPGGWWWVVSGQLYRGYALALPPQEVPKRLITWLPIWFSQFTWAGIPLIIAGVIQLTGNKRHTAYWLAGTAVLYLVFALTYLPDDAIVQTLSAWLLLSLLLVPAYQRLSFLALTLPLILLLINFSGQNLRADQQVRVRAEALLPAIPANAIVETSGDPTVFALWYFQHVEGQRPDLVLVDKHLFDFEWYRARLAQQYLTLSGLDQADIAVFRVLNEVKRPYCRASINTGLDNLYTLTCSEETSS